jgi:cysteine desulfurase
MTGAPTMSPIYLDHHATTPVDPRVAALVLQAMTSDFGNANSLEHMYGETAAGLVEQAREHVAALIGADAETVNFTSGSTESLRLALAHAVSASTNRPLRVVATVVEHRAVLDPLEDLAARGDVAVRYIPVDHQGGLDFDAFVEACQKGADLVCVMAAGNEVGTIYPLEHAGQVAERYGASLLVDATQAAGHIPIKTRDWGIAYLALSAHKIYGPKGVGALVAPRGFRTALRRHPVPGVVDGTPNVPGIAGLGEACRLRDLEMAVDELRMAAQRDRLETLLLAEIDDLVVNGDPRQRLSNNLHVSIPGVPNAAVIARLRRHVALSSGAACSTGAEEPSHVLRAMGLSYELQMSALRISNGKFTTDGEIERAAEQIANTISSVRSALNGAAV